MKLHFEDDLDYQKAAIDSVVSLFKGQEISRSEFTVKFQPESSPTLSLGMEESQLGIGLEPLDQRRKPAQGTTPERLAPDRELGQW